MRLNDIPNPEFAKKLAKMRRRNPYLGGDPEFFIADQTGRILPSDKFLPGKNDPIVLTRRRTWTADDKKLNKLFFDGIQGELNPAANVCREYLNRNLRELIREAAKQAVGKGEESSKNTIVLKPSVRVLKKVLEDADPEARVFGCMPDFNAYTLTTNTCEMDASKHFFRYAGGHIHIGISSNYIKKDDPEYKMVHEEKNHIRIIKFMDLMVGVLSVIFDKGKDAQRRRTKYGLAGCFRPTPYGVEYRTPSCWWLKSPILSSLVYGMARLGWNIIMNDLDEEFRKETGADDDTVRGICNESDVRSAKKLWLRMRPYIMGAGVELWNPLHAASMSKYKTPYGHRNTISIAAFDYIVKHGIEDIITDDILKEWCLVEPLESFNEKNGFVSGIARKLGHNDDFIKFQAAYYA